MCWCFGCGANGISAPQVGIEPISPILVSLNYWTTKEVPGNYFKIKQPTRQIAWIYLTIIQVKSYPLTPDTCFFSEEDVICTWLKFRCWFMVKSIYLTQ